jgi:hypothetical protein
MGTESQLSPTVKPQLELIVKSNINVVSFMPPTPAALMRINGGDCGSHQFLDIDKSRYVQIRTYIFDDRDPRKDYGLGLGPVPTAKLVEMHSYGWVPFDEQMAVVILDDFERMMPWIKTLVIHCNAGQRRSPAVAIALDELYGLGNKTLRDNYPEPNQWVYDTLITVGERRLHR